MAHTWFFRPRFGTFVAANSAIAELFPTALRGTIMGWITLCVAIYVVASQVMIAVLARPLGGLSNVIGWVSLLTVPHALT